MYSPLRLKSQEDRRLKGGHLWIYSNEIDTRTTPLTHFKAGELVTIESHRGEILGIGYINPHTLLAARLLTRQVQPIDENFFQQRLQQALQLRQRLFAKPFYRLVYGESDGLPGLVIDRYDSVLVVQITTAGMEQLKDIILTALTNTLHPSAILLRNDSSMRSLEGLTSEVSVAFGTPPDVVNLAENGVKFLAPVITGQKTGWFYDHRDNRLRLKKYVKDQRVLDLFSYIGGWGVQAAVFGAKEVLCIDSSKTAMDYLQQNAKLNNVAHIVKTDVIDAFDGLKKLVQNKQQFDVVIVDPPAFIKKRKDIQAGQIAYQRINELAMHLLSENGILVSSSCSLHLSNEMLIDVLRRGSVKLQRDLQILEQGQQAPDHPMHPAIPETTYLKALFCRVY